MVGLACYVPLWVKEHNPYLVQWEKSYNALRSVCITHGRIEDAEIVNQKR